MPGGNRVIAVVTTNKDKVLHSGPPVFFASTREEMEKVALLLSKTTVAMIHDLENDCLVIVQH